MLLLVLLVLLAAAAVKVRGATTHYDAVVSAATSGVLNASTDTGQHAVKLLA